MDFLYTVLGIPRACPLPAPVDRLTTVPAPCRAPEEAIERLQAAGGWSNGVRPRHQADEGCHSKHGSSPCNGAPANDESTHDDRWQEQAVWMSWHTRRPGVVMTVGGIAKSVQNGLLVPDVRLAPGDETELNG